MHVAWRCGAFLLLAICFDILVLITIDGMSVASKIAIIATLNAALLGSVLIVRAT